MLVSYEQERRFALLIGVILGMCLGVLTWFILVAFVLHTLDMLLSTLPGAFVR